MNLDERIEYLRLKNKYKKTNKEWYRKWWGILVVLSLYILAIFVLAFSFFLLQLKFSDGFAEKVLNSIEVNIKIDENFNMEDYKSKMLLVEGLNNNHLGKDDASITLVLFSDFNCSYCKSTAEVVAALNGKYGDRIKIIVREFPIMNDDSISLAIAALCAGDQGKYWQMYYKLFEVQGQFRVSDLAYIARLAGVSDVKEFSDCINSDKHYNDVYKNRVDGEALGIQGTPTWFLKGEKLQEGFVPFSLFSDFFDKYLVDDNN
ncbi:MAG: thioredoxin domain-containing protein [Patescibacteria group bacterium]